jgi:hypothetical protein
MGHEGAPNLKGSVSLAPHAVERRLCGRLGVTLAQERTEGNGPDKVRTQGKGTAMAQDKKQGAMENLKALGIAFMVFAVWDIIQSVIGIFNPSFLGIDMKAAAAAAGDAASIVGTVMTVMLVIVIAISLIQFYFGYIAFKLKPTKLAATVCLVVGVLGAIGVVSTITSSGISWSLIPDLCSVALAIMYWYYYKQLNNA